MESSLLIIETMPMMATAARIRQGMLPQANILPDSMMYPFLFKRALNYLIVENIALKKELLYN